MIYSLTFSLAAILIPLASGQGPNGGFDIASILAQLSSNAQIGDLLNQGSSLLGGTDLLAELKKPDPVGCFLKLDDNVKSTNAISLISAKTRSQQKACVKIEEEDESAYKNDAKKSCEHNTAVNLCDRINANMDKQGCDMCALTSAAVFFQAHVDCVCSSTTVRIAQANSKAFIRSRVNSCINKHETDGKTYAELKTQYKDETAVGALKCKQR